MGNQGERNRRYYVYQYHFLDNLDFIRPPEKDPWESSTIENQVDEVGSAFKQAGWEGDGTIGIIWLPPFVDVGVEDTHGTFVWHVKQSNNGTSWLASTVPLNCARLKEQNPDELVRRRRESKAINIIFTTARGARARISRMKAQRREQLRYLAGLPDKDAAKEIADQLLVYFQGQLVSELHEFLDDCYLSFLIEAVSDGNPSHLKIPKAKVTLDTARYLPEDEEVHDVDAAQWFTVQNLVSDMWHGFKFEPFATKTQMIAKSVDFKFDESYMWNLRKHVELRNCLQHQTGQITKDSLKSLGRETLTIGTGKKAVTLKAWAPIVLTEEELQVQERAFVALVDALEKHVDKRVPTRHYLTGGKRKHGA